MTSEDQKAARLAAALRANLAKRKAQKRAREEPPSDAERPSGVDEAARAEPAAGTPSGGEE